jgi:hypothetical protein
MNTNVGDIDLETGMFRIHIAGRHFSTKVLTVKEVVERAFRLSKVDETVSIEDADGRVLASFTKRSTV